MTGWLECVISCLVAVHDYLARLDGVDIELLRRSSFGFLEPNFVAMSDSIRIRPGLLNCSPSESDLLTLALNVTNDAVGSYRVNLKRSLPKDHVFQTSDWRQYVTTLELEPRNLVDLDEVRNGKFPYGGSVLHQITRCTESGQYLSVQIFN